MPEVSADTAHCNSSAVGIATVTVTAAAAAAADLTSFRRRCAAANAASCESTWNCVEQLEAISANSAPGGVLKDMSLAPACPHCGNTTILPNLRYRTHLR